MAAFFKAYGTKPSKQLTVGYQAKEMSLSTDYLAFLLEIGFKVTKIYWALEYQKGIPLIQYIEIVKLYELNESYILILNKFYK